MSNTTWMSVYTTKDLKLAARYEIPERHAEYFPFRFNNNVLFAGEESLIICTAAAKRVVRKPKRDPGIPLQISPSYFIIMSTAEITLYEFDSMTSTVTLAQSITHNVIKARFPAATDLMWTKCKVFDAALYCLDQSNGLFQFNPANFLDIKQRSTRRGCFDFVRPAS
ncbi:MAG: hypothetical protein JST59_01855 [Actinobacteria bacterium]|nr:hypothetical protein [Actinomycetota bacterium]